MLKVYIYEIKRKTHRVQLTLSYDTYSRNPLLITSTIQCNIVVFHFSVYSVFIYIYTRETAHVPRECRFGGGKKKVGVPSAPQTVLKLPQGHEVSEYLLSFEIGHRESGFYSGRTDR